MASSVQHLEVASSLKGREFLLASLVQRLAVASLLEGKEAMMALSVQQSFVVTSLLELSLLLFQLEAKGTWMV